MTELDIHDILRHLPHRYPFLLVDRVTQYEEGKRLEALKNVSVNEPFFPGHFPNHPVFPGVMILEAMAQASAILAFRSNSSGPSEDTLYLFVGIDKARFKRRVEPGDQLRIEVEVDRVSRGIWKFSTCARVDDETACTAEIMITSREVER